mgnify:CR=1 FL=1
MFELTERIVDYSHLAKTEGLFEEFSPFSAIDFLTYHIDRFQVQLPGLPVVPFANAVNDELGFHFLFSLVAYPIGPRAEPVDHHTLVVDVTGAPQRCTLRFVLPIVFRFDFFLQLQIIAL